MQSLNEKNNRYVDYQQLLKLNCNLKTWNWPSLWFVSAYKNDARISDPTQRPDFFGGVGSAHNRATYIYIPTTRKVNGPYMGNGGGVVLSGRLEMKSQCNLAVCLCQSKAHILSVYPSCLSFKFARLWADWLAVRPIPMSRSKSSFYDATSPQKQIGGTLRLRYHLFCVDTTFQFAGFPEGCTHLPTFWFHVLCTWLWR